MPGLFICRNCCHSPNGFVKSNKNSIQSFEKTGIFVFYVLSFFQSIPFPVSDAMKEAFYGYGTTEQLDRCFKRKHLQSDYG